MRRACLFVLLAAVPTAALADPGSWEQVGPAGTWKATIAGAVFKGRLYTAEDNGGLYVTNLDNGEWKQVGNEKFGGTKFLFAVGDHLCSINKAGSLFRIDPATGQKQRLGEEGAWKGTIAGARHKGKLYTVEDNGGLYVTNTDTGEWKQIGKADFSATKFVFTVADHLCTIDNDGNLYSVDPKNGSWTRLGDAGAWKGTIAGVNHKGMLYTTEDNGGLYETNTDSGVWKQLGKSEFGTTTFMFAAGDFLYTIEQDGSLYRVHVN